MIIWVKLSYFKTYQKTLIFPVVEPQAFELSSDFLGIYNSFSVVLFSSLVESCGLNNIAQSFSCRTLVRFQSLGVVRGFREQEKFDGDRVDARIIFVKQSLLVSQ